MQTWYKLPVVIGGALVITALGIDAADTIGGTRTTMLANVWYGTSGVTECPAGMSAVQLESGAVCVDIYEASVSPRCVHAVPTAVALTSDNLSDADCLPESVPHALPWRFVTRTQAERLCARAGKQLISNSVWYQAALGTEEQQCNTSSELAETGQYSSCVSSAGIYDSIGNVWELIAGDVIDGWVAGHRLPQSGFVAQVDAFGLPLRSTTTAQSMFNNDYVWLGGSGVYAIMRGGFYGADEEAGLYSVHAGIQSDFANGAVGFRCMKPL
jgi:hypothetical protein